MSVDMFVNNNSTARSTIHIVEQTVTSCKSFFKRINTRKLMRTIQAEIETQNEMRRTLNRFELTGISLGGVIGVGIFVLSGQAAARYAGPSVIISFVIAGIIALLSALSFSELATMMSVSGGAYTYTYAALGEYLAWFIAWNYTLGYQLGALTVVVGWSKYVVHFIDIVSDYNATRLFVEAPVVWDETAGRFFPTGQVINIPAIAITIGITLLLIYGIRPTALVNLVLVVIKIVVLLIFVFVCCKYVDRNNYKSFFPPNEGSFTKYGVTGMLQACTFVFFGYLGFESVAAVAQEAKTPTTFVPFATIASVVISLFIYIGICTVMVGLVPYKLLESDEPLSEAIKATPYGLWLLVIMDLGGIAALTTVALTTLLEQTRLFYAMAHDGLLPPVFAKIHSRRKTPWISTIISGIFCAVISGIFPVDIVGETSSISALIIYLFVHIEVIVMRYTHRHVSRIFQVPCGSWLVPTVGSLLCILLLKGISKGTCFRFLVWTAIGQIVYFSYGFWHSKRRPPAKAEPVTCTGELLPTVEAVVMGPMHSECELNLTNEAIESGTEDNFIHNF